MYVLALQEEIKQKLQLNYEDYDREGDYSYIDDGLVIAYTDYVVRKVRDNYFQYDYDNSNDDWKTGIFLKHMKDKLESNWTAILVADYDNILMYASLPGCEVRCLKLKHCCSNKIPA